jgi:hypothetical protein
MTIALATVPKEKKAAQEQCEKELSVVIGRIRVDVLEAGRLLTKLSRMHPHGTWMKYSLELYERLGISRSTGQRYIEAYECVKELGESVVAAAEVADLNLCKKPVRQQLAMIKDQHPEASPVELVKLTNLALAQGRPENKCQPTTFPLSEINAAVSDLRLKLGQLKPASTEPQLPALIRNLKVLAKEVIQLAQTWEML